MRNARFWVPILIAGMIGGCGQKGPLVLPDAPKHKKVAPSPRTPAVPAPAPAPPSGAPAPAATPATNAAGGPSDAPQKP